MMASFFSKGLRKVLTRNDRKCSSRTETRNELLYQRLSSFKPIVDVVEQAVLGLRDAADDFLSCTQKTLKSTNLDASVIDNRENVKEPVEEPTNKLRREAKTQPSHSEPSQTKEGSPKSPLRAAPIIRESETKPGAAQMDLNMIRDELDSATLRTVIIPIVRWKGSFEDLQDRIASLRRYEKEYECRHLQVDRFDARVEKSRTRYIASEKDSDGKKFHHLAKIMRRKEIKFEASKVAYEVMEKDLFDCQQQLLEDFGEFRTYLERMVTLQREAFSATSSSLGIAPVDSLCPSTPSRETAYSPTCSLGGSKITSSRRSHLPLPPTTAASATRRASFRAAFSDLQGSDIRSGDLVVGGKVLILREENKSREAESAASCVEGNTGTRPGNETSPVRSKPQTTNTQKEAKVRSPLSVIKNGLVGTPTKQKVPDVEGKENVEPSDGVAA